jgi:organic hydroperoxide reductase OsmC/OhrA
MIKYPLYFSGNSASPSGISTSWSSGANGLSPIECAIPQEFNGPGGGYSPEDLMVMAVMNCYIATFKVFAEKATLNFESIEVSGTIEINRLDSGIVGVKSLKINVKLDGASDNSKAMMILEETRKNCLMANALRISCEFSMHIN